MDDGNKPTPDSVLALAGSELARAVFRTANALLANGADAEEVTLDVLVSLRRKLDDVGEAGLEAWLHALPAWLDRSAVNKAKGRAKKRKHHSSTLDQLRALSEKLRASETPTLAAALQVKEVLAYLPRRHRFVFILAHGLGHEAPAIAELAHIDEPTVARTLATVQAKLAEYGAHHPMPKAMLAGMAPGVEDNPLRHYMETFGKPDEEAEARIQQRFSTYLGEDPGLELSGDYSFHDQQLSGYDFRVDRVVAAAGSSAGSSAELGETEPDLDPTPEPDAYEAPDRRRGGWIFGTVASIAVILLAATQLSVGKRLAAIEDTLTKLEQRGLATAPTADGPVLLEPGEFFELAHDSRAEPSKDAIVQLLRNDQSGAELRLESGSIGLHVKTADGVEWIVHDGAYDIKATGTRFRVSHTGAVPKVQVLEGKVQVTGGLLGAEGVEVTSSLYTLEAAMQARGDAPVAELAAPPTVDPKDVAKLATDEVYQRALATRGTKPEHATTLLREIVERGDDDWVTEMAFEHLRTLVPPDERPALQQAYDERFGDGQFAEAFEAIACQSLDAEDAQACWTEFGETYPDSLYGP